MRKNGFTLIELLAVIVILAIIALIATPIILGIINDARRSAFKNTAYGLLKAGELYYSRQQLELNGMDKNKQFTFPTDEVVVEGSVPNGTILRVNTKGQTALVMSNEKYCITKGYSDDDITIIEEFTECKIPIESLKNLAVTSKELGINNIDDCVTGTLCEPGTELAIQVNETTTEKFYVLSDDGENIKLIMARNLSVEGKENSNVQWINKEDYEAAGGKNWNSWMDEATFGPITALRALKERTANWTNLDEYSYDADYGTGTYSGEYAQNVRASLPSLLDVETAGCGAYSYGGNYCPSWLWNTNESSYWLSNGNGEDVAYYMDFGEIGSYYLPYSAPTDSIVNSIGIRPVITLSTNYKTRYTNKIMSGFDNCINKGKKCEVGTKVQVQVNENVSEDFYVINDDGNTIDLILNRNLGNSTVEWISNEDHQAAGGDLCSDVSCTYVPKGPITALRVLDELTDDEWSNIPPFTYTLKDFASAYPEKEIKNVRARMLNKEEVERLGCVESSNECPKFITSGLVDIFDVYWLSDFSWGDANTNMLYVWGITSGGLSSVDVSQHDGYLRPVITLTK